MDDILQCEAMRKLFVGGLNRTTTDETLRAHFLQFGDFEDCVIITDPNSQSRGFAFITYKRSESIETVFQSRPHTLDGKELDVKRAIPREFNIEGAHLITTKLFIGGFKDLDLTPEDVKNYLYSRHPQGSVLEILSVDFMKDKMTEVCKGFGFIRVATPDQADRLAISEHSLELKGRKLSIKKAEQNPGSGGRGGGRGGMRGRGRGGYDSGSYGNPYGGDGSYGDQYGGATGGNYGDNSYDGYGSYSGFAGNDYDNQGYSGQGSYDNNRGGRGGRGGYRPY